MVRHKPRALKRQLLAAGFALLATPALAHPHIFVDAKAVIVFDDAGAITEIRNSWTFDEAFSVWQTQGLDTNNDGVTSSEEMQELADDNIVGLAEYGFYTYAGEGDETLPLQAVGTPKFVFEGGRSTLIFAVAPTEPYRIERALEVAINDPEYYVAITFADASTVMLENAPVGCATTLEPPEEMSDVLQEQLFQLGPDVTVLPPDLAAALRGVQGAIVVTCPADAAAAAPETAVEAVTSVAETRPVPFGGLPPEPGFQMPRTGFLGWVADRQRDFYLALTAALAELKRDNNAFWVLGGLSFLYGVFHAAGPGHGKVVISSYVVANERQVRQGVALSFASALLQSLMAIAFVLVAIAVLDLTSATMNVAAEWIGIASYAMIALLGAWLIARKLFGFGHAHRHDPAKMAARAHEQLHGHDAHGRRPGDPHYGHDHGPGAHHRQHHDDAHGHGHAHAITPAQLGGGWREQLGVVLAVGLRPCSGALVVLAFALSQGLVVAGIAAVLLMGLGTALTVAVLASLAVGLKGLAVASSGRNAALAAGVVWWAELVGAVMVFGFGLVFLLASFGL
jgi:nickel/cobalt exporter